MAFVSNLVPREWTEPNPDIGMDLLSFSDSSRFGSRLRRWLGIDRLGGDLLLTTSRSIGS